LWFVVTIVIAWSMNSYLLLGNFDHKGDTWVGNLFELEMMPSKTVGTRARERGMIFIGGKSNAALSKAKKNQQQNST